MLNNRFILYIISYFVFGFYFQVSGQSLQAYEQKAAASFEQKNFSAALAYYEVVLTVNPENTNALFFGAESARHLRSFNIAENLYNKLTDGQKTGDYQLTDFWLASVKKGLHKYEEAADIYLRFLNTQPNAPALYRDQATLEIGNCKWAIQSLELPAPVLLEHYDRSVNSTYTDIAPVRSGDVLYFTSAWSQVENNALQMGEKQYFSTNFDGSKARTIPVLRVFEHKEGQAAIPFEALPVLPGQQTAHLTFSSDGNRLYYNICEEMEGNTAFRCKIYYRDKKNDGSWGDAIPLNDAINKDGTTSTQPSIGKDAVSGREMLFFASDREGTKGNLDIWVSEMADNGDFSEPKNLYEINTDQDDITPFFHAPSQTLFFSSGGHRGMGSYDIFKSQKSETGWSMIENLGTPFNSGYDDLYYSFDSGSGSGYFSSNRPGNYCNGTAQDCVCNDLYNYKVTVALNAITLNELSKKALIGSMVKLIDINTGEIDSFQINEIGNDFHFPLKYNKDYLVVATKDQYSSDTVSVSTKGLLESKIFNEELELKPKAKLLVLTYDALTLFPLDSTLVKLTDLTDSYWNQNRNGLDKNEFHFNVVYDKKYKIDGSREGYISTSKSFDIPDADTPLLVVQKLYLPKITGLPITLYYDNDHPTPNSWDTTTVYSYDQTYTQYNKLKNKFVTEYTKGMNGDQRDIGEQDMLFFFENDIRQGYENLVAITEVLYSYLKNGFELQIVLEGYASPLAKSEYNVNLTKRRIDCVINFFENYNNGVFKPYLERKSLTFIDEPKGEDESAKDVKDDPSVPRESIYGIKASKERRVRIIDVKKEDGILTIFQGPEFINH